MTNRAMHHALIPVAIAGLGVASSLGAQEGPPASAALQATPAGVVAMHLPSVVLPGVAPTTAAWGQVAMRADSVAARRRAFHVGAITGAALASGAAYLIWRETSTPRGDTVASPPGRAFVVSGILGSALLGGVAGVIVHDIRHAVAAP